MNIAAVCVFVGILIVALVYSTLYAMGYLPPRAAYHVRSKRRRKARPAVGKTILALILAMVRAPKRGRR